MPEMTRHCASCGRPMSPRRRFGSAVHPIKYCSKGCARRRVNHLDKALEHAIESLLSARAKDATICPSEAARHVAAESDWRTLMEPCRRAARRLAHAHRIEITQRGIVVDPGRFKGAIRLRKHRGLPKALE